MAVSSYVDLREKLKDPQRFSHQGSHRQYGKKHDGYYDDFDVPRSRYDYQTPDEREEELRKVHSGIKQRRLFSEEQCKVCMLTFSFDDPTSR